MPGERWPTAGIEEAGTGTGRDKGSHLPALEKESSQSVTSPERAWDRRGRTGTGPFRARLAGTNIRPSPQPVWDDAIRNQDPRESHGAFLGTARQVTTPTTPRSNTHPQ